MMLLLERASQTVDKEHWEEERKYLQNVFLKNGYSLPEIKQTFACFDNKKIQSVDRGRGGANLWDSSRSLLSNCYEQIDTAIVS